MKNIKNNNEINPLVHDNSLNIINTDNKEFYNSEFKNMKQDLLFFKNDILADIRKMEEKLNAKISDQNIIITQHYNFYEKQLDSLSTQISLTNKKIVDNSDMTEKLNIFQRFKSKIEDQVLSVNTKMISIQKEYKDYFNNFEQLIDDNLRYPGIIGKNARFQNFRYFIDHVLKYFKEYNQFRDEVKNWDIQSFKRNINSNLHDFRYAISDGYRNSLTLIENNNKKFDKKLEKAIESNKIIMDEHEEKLQKLKDKTIECLEEYKTKFEDLEKNMNEKYQQQLNEIENLKQLKNQVMNDMNNKKHNNEANTINNNSKNEIKENKYVIKVTNNNYISDGPQILNENKDDKNSEKESDNMFLGLFPI